MWWIWLVLGTVIPGTLAAAGLAWWVWRQRAAAANHNILRYQAHVNGTGMVASRSTPVMDPPLTPVLDKQGSPFTPVYPDAPTLMSFGPDGYWGRPFFPNTSV